MSFPFRNKPSLRERLRGKSGDEILNELRQKINQERKTFFNNPNWGGSSPASSTFTRRFTPEDVEDMMRGRGVGDSKLDEHLDKVFERHPDLAEEFREWRRGGEDSGERERLRNTVPDMTSQQEERGQRARSAPPQHFAPPSRVDSKDEMRAHHQQGPHLQQSHHYQQQPQSQHHQHSGPKVRHIPIFVEGRDEPLLPKEAQEESYQTSSVPSTQCTSSNQQPIPTHGSPSQQPIPAPAPPLQQPIPAPAPPQHPIPAPAPPPQQPPIPTAAPPSQQPIPAPAPPPQQPIPAPPPPMQQPIPAPPPPMQQPIPVPGPPQQGIRDPHDPIPAPPPPLQPSHEQNCDEPDIGTSPDRAMVTIMKVEEEMEALKGRVQSWKGGSKSDKEYIYLDEMLTRNLLKLDDVDTEGREEVRFRRRNAIKAIQQCISSLDTKTDPS